MITSSNTVLTIVLTILANLWLTYFAEQKIEEIESHASIVANHSE